MVGVLKALPLLMAVSGGWDVSLSTNAVNPTIKQTTEIRTKAPGPGPGPAAEEIPDRDRLLKRKLKTAAASKPTRQGHEYRSTWLGKFAKGAKLGTDGTLA